MTEQRIVAGNLMVAADELLAHEDSWKGEVPPEELQVALLRMREAVACENQEELGAYIEKLSGLMRGASTSHFEPVDVTCPAARDDHVSAMPLAGLG
jgi:hypothetical protein